MTKSFHELIDIIVTSNFGININVEVSIASSVGGAGAFGGEERAKNVAELDEVRGVALVEDKFRMGLGAIKPGRTGKVCETTSSKSFNIALINPTGIWI